MNVEELQPHRSQGLQETLQAPLPRRAQTKKQRNTKGNRGVIKGRVSIEDPSIGCGRKITYRAVEVDLMMGSNHKSALLVMTDRTTLVNVLEKLHSKNEDIVYLKMNKRLNNFNSSWIKAITFDNSKEFAHHHKIAKDLKEKLTLLDLIPLRTKEKWKIV
jgi:IS30 family transposase